MKDKKDIHLIHDSYIFPEDDSLYFDISVQAYGSGEMAVEFRTRFDLALALEHEQILPALATFENQFEWMILKPARIRLTKFMEERFRRGLAQQTQARAADVTKVSPTATAPTAPDKDKVSPAAGANAPTSEPQAGKLKPIRLPTIAGQYRPAVAKPAKPSPAAPGLVASNSAVAQVQGTNGTGELANEQVKEAA